MIYKWKLQGLFRADATRVKEELDSLGMKDSKPSDFREKIVKFARKKNSELHKCFQWDNDKAGHLFRLTQAKHIMNAIVPVIITADAQEINSPTTKITTDAMVSAEDIKEAIPFLRSYEIVSKDNQRQYMSIESISKDEDLLDQVLMEIAREVENLERKAHNYRSLSISTMANLEGKLREAREFIEEERRKKKEAIFNEEKNTHADKAKKQKKGKGEEARV